MSQSEDHVVARQNVGTVFRLHHKPLLMNVGHADLTLTIPYQIEPPSLRDMSTSQDFRHMIKFTSLPHAQHLIEISHMFDNMTLEIYHECMAVYADVAKVLANPRHSTYARETREFIQYISPIPYGIIGLARQQSVDILYHHMLTVDKALNSRDDKRLATDRIVRLLSSEQLNIKHALNHEADRLSQMIASVNGSLVYLAGQIQRITTDHVHELRIENTIFSVFVAVIADMISMGHYLDRYTPFLDALNTLNNGQLPHQLVSQAAVSKAYSNMTTFLEQQFNGTDHEGTTLTPLTEQELYSPCLVTFMYTENHLFAHLRVPTFHPRDRLHLYSVDIMPLPFHTNNVSALGYTILKEQPNRFAISPLVGTHVSFDLSKIAHCSNALSYLICDFPMATRPSGFDTCLSAIFEGNNLKQIHKLCTFMAFPTKTTPSTAVSLGSNKFAISTAFNSYSITCKTGTSMLRTPCGFCIVSLPPACSLSLEDLQIASTPMGLNKSLIVETHAVNLPLALAFDLPVTQLSAAFAHTAPIVLDLPKLSLKDLHKLPFSKGSLEQGVEITAMAAAIQQYDKMSAAHRASVEFVNTVSNPVTNTVLLIFNVFVAIALGIMVRKMYGMSQKLAFVYQTVTLIKPAESAPSQMPNDPMLLSKVLPTQESVKASLGTFNYETHLLAAILALIIMWTLVKMAKCLGKHLWVNPARTAASTANPALKLKVYTKTTNYLFHLMSFKAEAPSISFHKVPTLTNVIYKGGPSVSLTWSCPLTFSICDEARTLNLSSSVSVPPLLRYDVRRSLGKVQSEKGNGIVSALIFKAANKEGIPVSPVSLPDLEHSISPAPVAPATESHDSPDQFSASSTTNLAQASDYLENRLDTCPVVIIAGEGEDLASDLTSGQRLLRALALTLSTSECLAERS